MNAQIAHFREETQFLRKPRTIKTVSFFAMEPQDTTEISVCIGTFDPAGVPISISGHMSDWATVAFQAISLNRLLSHHLAVQPATLIHIHNKDGVSVRIERHLKGFTGYLDVHQSGS